jgi:hypothetical protein
MLLASCAGTASGSGSGSSPTGSSAQGGSGSGGSGSAQPAGTARADPPAASDTASQGASGCLPAPAVITARTGEQPAPVCLRVGASLTITAQPSPAQPWQPMTTSNPAVLACTSRAADRGALTATCRALAPGTATISTTTAAFAGDPHGPPQYTWTLTVHVQPAS